MSNREEQFIYQNLRLNENIELENRVFSTNADARTRERGWDFWVPEEDGRRKIASNRKVALNQLLAAEFLFFGSFAKFSSFFSFYMTIATLRFARRDLVQSTTLSVAERSEARAREARVMRAGVHEKTSDLAFAFFYFLLFFCRQAFASFFRRLWICANSGIKY